jgi:acetyl/propionyl-CoA carboxylase alpha subunit
MSFHKILLANRGEIACRVMRTARALGYRTVAVYSDADASAPHVALADEAVHIGPALATQSYLNIQAILDAARKTGADAIHPGYGFLSERADFAQACADAGLVFIGPPPGAIEAMGNKAGAKRRMLAAGVPCAPGYLGEDQSDACFNREAQQLGLPLLVKAVAGGGGRGMRLVRDMAELAPAIAGARREALNAFGDGTLMLERLIEGGRHIEIQVFADAHGNAIHLGERDCTSQRRRQKVIEEAPSPVVNPAMRQRMGADAVAAALAVGYRGAGTVEFIVDAQLQHYFLEMNTRLQVEHPVTECITGLDLVEWQLRVAAGEPLPLKQDQVQFQGHAIEVRLYAEDPYTGFTPQTGTVLHWRPDAALLGRDAAASTNGYVRIDPGINEGSVITPFYDPMVAKVIAKGRNRDDAIRRLTAALEDTPLLGLRNNGRFLRDLLNHPAFKTAKMDVNLLDRWFEQGEPLLKRPQPDDHLWHLAAAALAMRNGAGSRPVSVGAYDLSLDCADTDLASRTLRLRAEGQAVTICAGNVQTVVEVLELANHAFSYRIDSVQGRCVCMFNGDNVYLVQHGAIFRFSEKTAFPRAETVINPRQARAPVAGTISAIQVASGDTVTEGQALVCVEAMKMEMWLHAGGAGRITAVNAQLRESVVAGAVLVEIELQETTP